MTQAGLFFLRSLVPLCRVYGSGSRALCSFQRREDKLNPDFYRPQLQQARHPQKHATLSELSGKDGALLMKLLFKAESQLWILQ